MSHTITDHRVNGLNESISIVALDSPGAGGANHRYSLALAAGPVGPDADPSKCGPVNLTIEFQNGPIGEVGYNGFTNEALLAVLIDRLRGFQGIGPHAEDAKRAGKLPHEVAPFACRENAIALTHLEEALMWIQKRTRDRMARGVEGSYQK